MDEAERNQSISNTWTDELNNALAPVGLLLSGIDALSILPPDAKGSLYASLRAFRDEDFAVIAQQANEDCETDQIQPAHIRDAVRRTLWHWDDH